MAATAAIGRQTMVVGIDGGELSHYALQWTLRHFFSSPNPIPSPLFQLVLVHVKRSASSVIGCVDSESYSVFEKAKELCAANQVSNVMYEILEGDPSTVLCETVEKYPADVLVVGSHGYGTVKRAVLGSVSDYCAHHARCTMMIVKKPKVKN